MQSTVAASTAEAEYMALSHAAKEALWLQSLFSLMDKGQEAITLYSDSTSCIAMAQNPIMHHRTKHIDIQYHFVRHYIEKGIIVVKSVPTELQIADMCTKAVTTQVLNSNKEGAGVR